MSGREAAPLTLLGEASDTLLVAGGEGAEAGAENPALADWGRSGRRIASSLLQFEPARGRHRLCIPSSRAVEVGG
jgi:hypothetical protein